jgi:hypothetical protein
MLIFFFSREVKEKTHVQNYFKRKTLLFLNIRFGLVCLPFRTGVQQSVLAARYELYGLGFEPWWR